MLNKLRKFDLRSACFHSGKKLSPPREFWNTCNCCGKKIVKGVVMSNADTIGEDCYEVVQRVQANSHFEDAEERNRKLFKMFGTLPKVQQYAKVSVIERTAI